MNDLCKANSSNLANHCLLEERIIQMAYKKQKNQGQALTEYLILIVLIAIASLVIVRSVGTQVKNKFSEVRDRIEKL